MGTLFCDAVVWKQTKSQASGRWEGLTAVGAGRWAREKGKAHLSSDEFCFALVLTNPLAFLLLFLIMLLMT